MTDNTKSEALAFFHAFCAAMKDWEERCYAFTSSNKGQSGYEAGWQRFVDELDEIHNRYSVPTDWPGHVVVSHPSVFDVTVTETVRKTRNHFIIHVFPNQGLAPRKFQFDVRRIKGAWKVERMWQTLANGKRVRCPF